MTVQVRASAVTFVSSLSVLFENGPEVSTEEPDVLILFPFLHFLCSLSGLLRPETLFVETRLLYRLDSFIS